jgi:carboxymethylenebutenolidase
MSLLSFRLSLSLAGVSVLVSCQSQQRDEHTLHETSGTVAFAGADTSDDRSLPADASHAIARLKSSTRHGEWATTTTAVGDSIRMWVVYPEKSGKTPVVIVIHEIFGLTNWVRAVADQLAADGYIAIAPDLLTMQHLQSTPEGDPIDARQAISKLDPELVQRQLDAVAKYGLALPAAAQSYGVVGFCWGGAASFNHAVHTPSTNLPLQAAVVYYGTSPREVSNLRAPVLGLYGGNDARVTATIPAADSGARAAGKTYQHVKYEGAGHGFLRQQRDSTGANMKASKEAWPATLAWFGKYLKK